MIYYCLFHRRPGYCPESGCPALCKAGTEIDGGIAELNITVYCGAHEGNDPEFVKRASELGTWMAEHGHRLVFGSGRDGMMGAVSHALISAGGESIGVTPQFFIDAEETRDDLTELIVTPDMHTRRYKMIELGDAFIALPGGTGTLDEITEVIALKRLGKLGNIEKPIMIYNVNGYYDRLFEFFDEMSGSDFCRSEDRANVIEVRCIEDIDLALRSAGGQDTTRNRLYDGLDRDYF